MPVSDQDVELLESWLDGELSDADADALRRRMHVEADLAQRAEQLREQRASRAMAWRVFEPTELASESLIANVRRAVIREEVWSRRLRIFRGVAAVAASIVVVFMAGWVSHERIRFNSASPAPVNQAQFPSVATNNLQPIEFPQNSGQVNLVSAPYQVKVVDSQGKVIAVQPLNRVEDPQKFTDQMNRFQLRQQQQQQRRPSDPVFIDQQY